MAISEFTTPPANTNTWTSVETDAVGGSTKYGIYVTNTSNPRYTFLNSSFYPAATAGSIAIVELYANAEGQGAGDPNTANYIYDGVALTNVGSSSIPTGSLSSNTAVYGVNSNTKQANYVYNFTNKGYADTKKMAIGGNKNRRVFAIRSWGTLNANYNEPYIAFIGDSSALNYDGSSAGFSVGCAGATRTTSANTWVSHTAGDGTKYYSITNTANNVNKYVSISLTAGHTYRFTLHAHTQATYDGVAICKTTNTLLLSSLTASDLISGSTSTGKCSGKDETTTFDYTAGASAETRYIYFKSNSSTIGASDGKSFADVMVEDLGDLRATQAAPTAANVTVEYEETATASASGGGGHGTLQYRTQNPTTLGWNPWTTTAPARTELGTTKYQAMYRGNASYKPSAVSNTATLAVIPRKIIKPTPVTTLVYNGYTQTGVNPPRYATIPSSPTSLIVEASGTVSAKNAGNYSVTYKIKDTTNYCWSDGTTSSVTVNWSIAQREVTLSWGTTSWTYDGNSHSTTCTVGNLVGSDSCFINLSGNNITNAGSTTVTATALSNSNYKLPSNKSTTLTVTAKEAILSWGTTSWTYDGNSHSTTCTVSNLVGSDSCTVNLSNNSITDIGSISVTAASLSNSNYKLPLNKSTILTIRPCMYVKVSNGWVPVIQAYKKENGVWVRQTTTIGSLFSTGGRYLGRYQDPKTGEWKNLIDG